MCRMPWCELNTYFESLGTIDVLTTIGSYKMSKYKPCQRWSNLTCHPKIPTKKGQCYDFFGIILDFL